MSILILRSSAGGAAQLGSILFNGNLAGTGSEVDRVAILADSTVLTANIGAEDMCFDVFLNADTDNAGPAVSTGNHYNWINGNIAVDRDRFGQPRAWGLSLCDGRVAWGLNVGGTLRTLVGTTDIRGLGWSHVRGQRSFSSGDMWLYVRGDLEANGGGPSGDLSCPNTGNSGWDPYLLIGVEKHDADIVNFPSYYGGMCELLFRNLIPSIGSTITIPQEPWSVSVTGGRSLWRCNDGAGTTLADSIGNSPGTLLVGGGFPQWSALSPFS